MILVLNIIIGLYSLLVLCFIIGFNRTPTVPLPARSPKSSFSIVIAFRNEENNLPTLLKSLSRLKYPPELYEIFLVNDSSEDGSTQIILDFIATQKTKDIHLLENLRRSASPKKDAIQTAIHCAQHDWIVTTDADCVLPTMWLQSLDNCIQTSHPELIAAPITLIKPASTSFLHSFESLDVHSLLGATIGAFGIGKPFMANGANLCYQKTSFLSLNGFDGNDHIASGDDIFMLEKFKSAFPNQVIYLKNREAIVETSSQENWKGLFSQRIRWAAKATGYSGVFPKAVGALVFLTNLTFIFVILFLLTIIINETIFTKIGCATLTTFITAFAKAVLPTSLYFLLSKLIIDGILIWKGLVFTDSKKDFTAYPLVALLYPFVSVYVAIRALTGTYQWKGRQFKQ